MEAYIYTYVNRETKKTYIGARCAYTGSCYDDFNIKYFSSSKDKQFRKDMSDGKHHSAEIRKKMSDAIKLNSNTKWITPDGEIKMMNSGNVKRWHPDWVLYVQETENTY